VDATAKELSDVQNRNDLLKLDRHLLAEDESKGIISQKNA
jgi:hypothetical protein